MNINHSSGPEVLPEFTDYGSIEDYLFLLQNNYEVQETMGQRQSMLWAIKLMFEFKEKARDYYRSIPGLRGIAFGYLDPDYEVDDFGVILIGSDSYEGPDSGIQDRFINEQPYRSNILDYVRLSEKEFPIVIRRINKKYYSPSIHPVQGTSGCWAKSRITSDPIGPGFLTVKHVTGSKIGAPILLSNGRFGHVLDVAPQGIDAALISSTEVFPGFLPRPIQRHIAPWTDAYFMGAASGYHHTKITAITDTFGILNTPSLPVRIFLADAGTHGDSGALIVNDATKEAIGLLMGEYSNPAGQTGGFSQHLYQVKELMDMEVYL